MKNDNEIKIMTGSHDLLIKTTTRKLGIKKIEAK